MEKWKTYKNNDFWTNYRIIQNSNLELFFKIFSIFKCSIFLKNQYLKKKKILFFCGAGISQESGLGTFRGDNGLWENHDLGELPRHK